MTNAKQRDTESAAHPRSISSDASDWFQAFAKHLEFNFVDAGANLPVDADVSKYQLAAMRAVLQTFLDSGMYPESVLEAFGQASVEGKIQASEWTPDMNNRRFELIDKEIQGSLTAIERIELVGLTGIMRQHTETEMNMPMEGAKLLHRKLMELDGLDEPH